MKKYNAKGKYFIPKDTLVYIAEIDDIVPFDNAGYNNPILACTDKPLILDFSKTKYIAYIEESPRRFIGNPNEIYFGFFVDYNKKQVLLRLLIDEKDFIVL